jgi:prepilin-type N-terminal cleavage/methylation domain-containing protein
MQTTPHRRGIHPSAGFTLIELLTVIAIIGILAAILIPTVGRVRESAYSAKTVSNIRLLHQANRLHATEWRGLFVPAVAGSLIGNGVGSAAEWYNNPNFVVYFANRNLNGWTDPNTIIQTGKPGALGPTGGVTLGLSLGGNSFFTPAGGNGRAYSFRDSEVDRAFPGMVMFADVPSQAWATSGRRDSPTQYNDDAPPTARFGAVAFRYSGKAHFVLASGAVVRWGPAESLPTDDAEYRRLWPDPTNGNTTATALKVFAAPY